MQALTNKHTSNDAALRVIAIFKLLKAILLLAAGVSALTLSYKNSAPRLGEWIGSLGLEPGHSLLEHAITRLVAIDSATYAKVGLGSLVYSVLFLTEGAGLWLGKPWAEWFTVIITGSLIPLEVYELVRRPALSHTLVIVLNVAIVGYLLFRILKRRRG